MPAASTGSASRRKFEDVNQQIGARLRLARNAAKISQAKLAAGLGITFQQVQKYEKGTSTISAPRLHNVAVILGVPLTFFFPGPEATAPSGSAPEPRHRTSEMIDLLTTNESIDLGAAFQEIDDSEMRKRIVNLVRSTAGSGDGAPS